MTVAGEIGFQPFALPWLFHAFAMFLQDQVRNCSIIWYFKFVLGAAMSQNKKGPILGFLSYC